MLVPAIAFWIVAGLLGGYVFAWKGYSPVVGVVLGLILGPIWMLLVWLILPKTAAGREQARMELATRREMQESSKSRLCPTCGRANSVTTRICPRCDARL